MLETILARFLRQYGIAYLFLATALFQQMVEYEVETLAAIPQVQAGGEVVSPSHVRRLLEQGGICISTAYILDANLQPVPIGMPEELTIGDDGLAWAYLINCLVCFP